MVNGCFYFLHSWCSDPAFDAVTLWVTTQAQPFLNHTFCIKVRNVLPAGWLAMSLIVLALLLSGFALMWGRHWCLRIPLQSTFHQMDALMQAHDVFSASCLHLCKWVKWHGNGVQTVWIQWCQLWLEIYFTSIFEKLFTAALAAGQIESMGGYDAVNWWSTLQAGSSCRVAAISFLNTGHAAPGVGPPMFGAWGQEQQEMAYVSNAAECFKGGRVLNPPAAARVSSPGPVNSQNLLILNDRGGINRGWMKSTSWFSWRRQPFASWFVLNQFGWQSVITLP